MKPTQLPHGLAYRVVTVDDSTIKAADIADLIVIHGNSLTSCTLTRPLIAQGVTTIVHKTVMNDARISGTVRANHSIISSSHVIDGGFIEADNGCSCCNLHVEDGGYFSMMSGSYASGLYVANDGVVVVSPGAVVSDLTTGGDEADVQVLSGGTVSVAEVGWCDRLDIANGAVGSEISVQSGGNVLIGDYYPELGRKRSTEVNASFLYISSGGFAVVKGSGTVVKNVHVSTGGSLVISSGAIVDICHVRKGAHVHVCDRGTLKNLCGAGSGGIEADSDSWVLYKNKEKN